MLLQNCEKRLLTSPCSSAWNNSFPSGPTFMKFDIPVFFANLSRKLKFHYNLAWISVTLRENLSTFMIISCLVILRLRNVSDEICRENQNTHFMSHRFFFFENRAVYEIRKKKNIIKPEDRPQMTWPMCIACWISKNKNTPRIRNTYCFFYCHKGCTKAPLCYLTRTLLILFYLWSRGTVCFVIWLW